MEINSYAKINLGLHILNKRQDEYHNIITVFQEIDFCDQISIEKSDDFIFETNVDWLDKKNNTCIQAFNATKEKFPNISNIKINLIKNIPPGAGLGGGSSNGTSTLKGINELFALKMSHDDLIELSKKISADSPFFVNGGLQIGEGTGGDLSPVESHLNGVYILLVMPDIKIDTKNAYKKCLLKDKTNIKFAGMLDELKNYDLSSELFYNDFEVYVFTTHPEIGKIKLTILDLGAKYASLSGSGSTVFGIFSNKKDALKAHQFFSPHFSTIITNPKI
ncbi:MAG: 4-diphosphocytidyl-2-C-methyl-D-erythritol kinase [Candidatus Neomarinimicrobiota bacterium]|nr:MAG: 4-diphosphocytidyl-2-C-methyl-D-erythritol kinase [Candidatus Neomarinimicrobiota bacterium]